MEEGWMNDVLLLVGTAGKSPLARQAISVGRAADQTAIAQFLHKGSSEPSLRGMAIDLGQE